MNKKEALDLPITTVEEIGEIGPYHADINGKTSSGGIRGPFDISPINPNAVPTYPVLWSHEAERERTITFEADCEGTPRRGQTAREKELIALKVAEIWKSASHCHCNRDFRFNSQSTAMQFTSRATIGGVAWPSIKMATVEQEMALVLWANSTLGLLMYWWHSNKQQDGRGRLGVLTIRNLPILNTTALTPKQLSESAKLFRTMNGKPMRTINEIGEDSNRKELDESFVRKVLGLAGPIIESGGPLELLRMKLGREPSIRGQK
jgi:hypothetical protein